MGDIHLPQWLTPYWVGLVLDVTITHPYNAVGAAIGLAALSAPAKQKLSEHRVSYAPQHPPTAFLPVVAGTDGLLHADTLRLIWTIADRQGATTMAARDGCTEEAVYGEPFFRLRA
eukprot:555984-Hanusia_phi.AAC.1